MTSIQAALAPVLRDVAQTTEVALQVESGDSADGPWVRVVTPDGGTSTSYLDRMDSEAELVAFVADKIQEVVIEELWARASNWPMCPTHRSTHPLQAAVVSGEAVWRCPATGAPVAPVGALRP